MKKTFKDIKIWDIKKPEVIIDEPVEPVESVEATPTYYTFLLFYELLKAKKYWHSRQWGRMYNGLQIRQRWEDYYFIYNNIEYTITKDCNYDFTQIILEHIN